MPENLHQDLAVVSGESPVLPEQLPPPAPNQMESPVDGFIDPERARQAALESVQDLQEGDWQIQQDSNTLRPAGRRLLQTIENPDSSQEELLGARILLMEGTKTERQLLFLHDAFEVVGQTVERNRSTRHGPTRLGELATDIFDSTGSLQALAEKQADSEHIRLAARVADGKEIADNDVRSVIRETFSDVVQHIEPGDIVELLRKNRELPIRESFIDERSPKTLETLCEKVQELPMDAPENSLIMAESLALAAERSAFAALQMAAVGGWRNRRQRRQAAYLKEAADTAVIQAYCSVPFALSGYLTYREPGPQCGTVDLRMVSQAIAANQAGISANALAGILRYDASFLRDNKLSTQEDLETVNRIGESFYEHGIDSPYGRHLYSGMMLADLVAEAKAVRQLEDHAIFTAIQGTGAEPTMSRLMKAWPEQTRAEVLDALVLSKDQPAFNQLILTLKTSEDLTRVVTAVSNPDSAEYANLMAFMSRPNVIVGLASREQRITKLLGVNCLDVLLADTEQANLVRSELLEMLGRPGIAEAVRHESIDYMLTDSLISSYMSAKKPGLSGLNEFTQRQHEALVACMDELFQLPGVADACDGIVLRNPHILREAFNNFSFQDLETVEVASILQKLSMTEIRFNPANIEILSGADRPRFLLNMAAYEELELDSVISYVRGATGLSYTVLGWMSSPETGPLAEKVTFLKDPEIREVLAATSSVPVNLGDAVVKGLLKRDESRARTYFQEIGDMVQTVRREGVGSLDTFGNRKSIGEAVFLMVMHSDDPAQTWSWFGALQSAEIGKLSELFESPSLTARFLESYIKSDDPARYISEWAKLANETKVYKVLLDGGMDYALDSPVARDLLSAESPFERAREYDERLNSNRPLWQTYYLTARMLIRSDMHVRGMKVSEVPSGLPTANAELGDVTLDALLDESRLMVPVGGMDDEERQLHGVGKVEDDMVNVDDLSPDTRQTLLAYRLFETVQRTRSRKFQEQATRRNKAAVLSGVLPYQSGELTHFTLGDNLGVILLSGNVPREVLGSSDSDSYPFNVDFIRLDGMVTPYEEGGGDKLFELADKGDICLHYARLPGCFRESEEYSANNHQYGDAHYLLFGGMPSPELTAITVRHENRVGYAVDTVVEAGYYIPVYDGKGNLCLSPDEYDKRRRDSNLDTFRPRIIDAGLNVGKPLGSQPGGEVYLNVGGISKRYYEKHAGEKDVSRDRVVTEVIVDQLYALNDPDMAPKTELVVLNGQLSRLSEWIEPEGELTQDVINGGFFADCVLSAWDAAGSNQQSNLVPRGKSATRIDNGGALDYRAKGARKGGEEYPFDEAVRELEMGDGSRLGHGMRRLYPGITNAQIKRQAEQWRANVTYAAIDRVIDPMPLPSERREYLKRLVKGRTSAALRYADSLPDDDRTEP